MGNVGSAFRHRGALAFDLQPNESPLPILHTQREDRHDTALFSNTARAHQKGATHDWVVVYRDDADDGRWTVVTAKYRKLRGKRIVSGKESMARFIVGI